MSLVAAIREILDRPQGTPLDVNGMLQPEEGNNCKLIPQDTYIATLGAKRARSMTAGGGIALVSDRAELLKRWIDGMSDAKLRALLDKIPEGPRDTKRMRGFQLTLTQRLFVLWYALHPFQTESRCLIGTDDVMRLAYRGDDDPRGKRKRPFQAQRTLVKGMPPEIFFADLDTGLGKTALSLCAALVMLCDPQRYAAMRKEHRRSFTGQVATGDPSQFADLALVLTKPTTHDHFERTAEGVIAAFQEKHPDLHFRLWSGQSKNYSVQACVAREATAGKRTITVWILPTEKGKLVRGVSPDVTIGFAIADEMNEETGQRWKSPLSQPLKWFVCQATLSKIDSRSLPGVFAKELILPCRMEGLLGLREFSRVQVAVDQAAQLLLSTTGDWNRYIGNSMRPFLPSALEMHYIRSAQQGGLASRMMRSCVDLLPMPLSEAVVRMLDTTSSTRRLTAASKERLAQLSDLVAPSELIRVIGTLEFCNPWNQYEPVAPPHERVQQIQEHLRELVENCPICFEPVEDQAGLKIFPCCTAATCAPCAHRIGDKCAFCRAPPADMVAVREQTPKRVETRRISGRLQTVTPRC